MKADVHIQDLADFRVSTNPSSHSGCSWSRDNVYSRHNNCIQSDLSSSSSVMKNGVVNILRRTSFGGSEFGQILIFRKFCEFLLDEDGIKKFGRYHHQLPILTFSVFELIDRNETAKNQFNGCFASVKVNRLLSFSFASHFSLSKVERHAFSLFPILRRVCEFGSQTISSHIQAPEMHNVLPKMFEHIILFWSYSQYNCVSCPDIDMKMILPLNTFDSVIICWFSVRILNVVNPEKLFSRIPLVPHRFDPNLWDSTTPKTKKNPLPRLRQVYFSDFPDRAPSRKRRRFGNSQHEQPCHVAEVRSRDPCRLWPTWALRGPTLRAATLWGTHLSAPPTPTLGSPPCEPLILNLLGLNRTGLSWTGLNRTGLSRKKRLAWLGIGLSRSRATWARPI